MDQLSSLLSALSSPTSPPSPQQTQQIQSYYTQPGFYSSLQQIARNRNERRESRVLASVIMKNEMPQRWRGKTTIPDEEKVLLRNGFFGFMEEPDQAISQIHFWILQKVSRTDFPRAWPTLIDDLHNSLISSAQARFSSQNTTEDVQVRLRNHLRSLNSLVKEWSEVKIPLGSKVMYDLVRLMFPTLVPLFTSLMDLPRTAESAHDAESALLCWRVLARLIVWEWNKPPSARVDGYEQRLRTIFPLATQQLPPLLSIRSDLLSHLITLQTVSPAARSNLKNLTKHVGSFLKFLRRLEEKDPKMFATLPGANETVLMLWEKARGTILEEADKKDVDPETSLFPPRLVILSLLLFKDILPIWASVYPQIFDTSLITNAFHTIVNPVLLLTPTDIEELEDDPEEWSVAEMSNNEQWLFNLRACGERILMSLSMAARHREDKLVDQLLQISLSQALSTPITDLPSLLRREAVFTAAGRLARSLVLNPNIPPSQFLIALADESISAPNLLRRRIAWLIGELVDAEEDLASNELVWTTLLRLVGKGGLGSGEDNDFGVRLAAAGGLRAAMDLWESDASCFEVYNANIAEGLLTLLDDVQTLEGKRQVLKALDVLIERIGTSIVPFMHMIVPCIPQLWENSSNVEGQWLFKSSLLELTAKLVNASQADSHHLGALCVQLINHSLEPASRLHLAEDARLIWVALLRNAASPSSLDPGIVQLAQAAISQLEEDRDSVDRCLEIVDGYVLIAGKEVYQNFGDALCQALKAIITSSQPAQVHDTLQSLCLHAQAVPLSLLAPGLTNSGIFSSLFQLATSPTVGAALPYITSFFARAALSDPNVFLEVLNANSIPVATFLDCWWSSFDRIPNPSIRKRVALASSALCSTSDPTVLGRFAGEFVNLFLDVMGELKEQEETDDSVKLLWQNDADGPELADSAGTAEANRRTELWANDPVYNTSLKKYLRARLADTPALAQHVDVHDPAFVELQKYLG